MKGHGRDGWQTWQKWGRICQIGHNPIAIPWWLEMRNRSYFLTCAALPSALPQTVGRAGIQTVQTRTPVVISQTIRPQGEPLDRQMAAVTPSDSLTVLNVLFFRYNCKRAHNYNWQKSCSPGGSSQSEEVQWPRRRDFQVRRKLSGRDLSCTLLTEKGVGIIASDWGDEWYTNDTPKNNTDESFCCFY